MAFGKITAFDENHGFRDFRDLLSSLMINYPVPDSGISAC